MIQDKITIVIPNYNGRDALKRCIDSVLGEISEDAVIVVDDGSSDDSAEMVQRNYPGVRMICFPDNRGFAAAVNAGIRGVETPYVFLLNNDARILPGALHALLKTMERMGERCFSVGAKMLTAAKPRRIDNCGDLYAICGWAFTPGRGADPSWYSHRSRVTSACAGAALYRRDALLALGMFDEAHFCYLEDVDLGIRARLHGYRNYYEPAAVVLHEGSASSGGEQHSPFKVRLTAGNNLYLLYKNFPVAFLVLYAPFLLGGILVKGVFFARKGMLSAYLEGLKEGVGKIAAYRERGFSGGDPAGCSAGPADSGADTARSSAEQETYGSRRFVYLLALIGEMYVNLIRRFVG